MLSVTFEVLRATFAFGRIHSRIGRFLCGGGTLHITQPAASPQKSTARASESAGKPHAKNAMPAVQYPCRAGIYQIANGPSHSSITGCRTVSCLVYLPGSRSFVWTSSGENLAPVQRQLIVQIVSQSGLILTADNLNSVWRLGLATTLALVFIPRVNTISQRRQSTAASWPPGSKMRLCPSGSHSEAIVSLAAESRPKRSRDFSIRSSRTGCSMFNKKKDN
ncbi:hypothetical protein BJ170DRAFT_591738 [Xylariales sp. AK1849]|nr:hypothetical protein BJ170DRAFT_591738 [Xylariales sp. AK1849]